MARNLDNDHRTIENMFASKTSYDAKNASRKEIGHVFVINNVATEFPATQDVVARMESFFVQKKFKVAVMENLNHIDMSDFVNSLEAANFEDYKLFFLLILSHGFGTGTPKIVATEKDFKNCFCIDVDIIQKLSNNPVI